MAVRNQRQWPVYREMNRLTVRQLDHPRCVTSFLKAIYHGTRAGFTDFDIDFSPVGVVYPNACAPVAGLLDFYRNDGVKFRLVGSGPEYLKKTSLWQPHSASEERQQLDAACLDRVWRFGSDDISAVVDAMVKELTRSIQCEEGVLQSVEWSLNEVMDNVIQHATVDHGFVMAQVHTNAKHVAFCVFDWGRGIFESLRGSVHNPRNPTDAISLAIKEGVTRSAEVGQGNGLWGLYELVRRNTGALTITSASSLWMMCGNETRTIERLPFPSRDNGTTTVDFQLDTSQPISIVEALRGHDSRGHSPVSIYLEQFETESDFLSYPLAEQASGTGTRASGARIRNEIVNLQTTTTRPVILDFSGVSIVSSSFADELIGKLIVHYGFVAFTQTIHLRNMNQAIQSIVQRSVTQRMAEATGLPTSPST